MLHAPGRWPEASASTHGDDCKPGDRKEMIHLWPFEALPEPQRPAAGEQKPVASWRADLGQLQPQPRAQPGQ